MTKFAVGGEYHTAWCTETVGQFFYELFFFNVFATCIMLIRILFSGKFNETCSTYKFTPVNGSVRKQSLLFAVPFTNKVLVVVEFPTNDN